MTLIFKPDELLVARFDGFGAQYNQNLFAERSRDAGVTEAGVKTMKPKLAALAPQMARLFFHHDALADDDLLTSFDGVPTSRRPLSPTAARSTSRFRRSDPESSRSIRT
jgi:hypothetical protein